MTDKPLPHNQEAERSILGAILIDESGKALGKVQEKLHSSEDFYLPQNRVIYSEMLAMATEQQSINPITLTDNLRFKALLERAGGIAYVESLADGIPRLNQLESYAAIVAEKAQRRRLAYMMSSFQNSALEDGSKSIAELQNELDKCLREMPRHHPNGTNGNGNGHFAYGLMEFLAAQFPVPDHLVEGIIPRGGTGLILALPHRLKSWFTTALALGCTRAGTIMGKLQVNAPVRTILAQVEDFPGQLQWRIQQLLRTRNYDDIIPSNVKIIPRCQLDLMDETCFQKLLHEVIEFQADLVIIDVVRRVFRGDINSPKESTAFLEQVDRIRDAASCAVILVHHENKKDEEIMKAGAGSYTLPSWANVMMQFKRKTQEGNITHVEIEVDNKLAQSPEPMRMVLDLTSEMPVRIEALEDGDDWQRIAEQLGDEWTVKDFSEVLQVHRSNATRRLQKLIKVGRVEKVQSGKRGRFGGLARYKFLNGTEDSTPEFPPVSIRRIQ